MTKILMKKREKPDVGLSNLNEKGKRNVTKMNKYQNAHLNNEMNVYRPIEAYTEEWVHEEDKYGRFVRAYPKPNTKRRLDLPSLCDQWKADAVRRWGS